MYIDQIANGDAVEGFYLLSSAFAKTTVSGRPYLSMVLGDCSGSVDAVAWDYSGPVTPADTGNVVLIRGHASEYRGSLQITVDRLRAANANDSYSVDALVPTAPIDTDSAYGEIEQIVSTITDADYAAVCREMLRQYGEQLRVIPAAKSVHHSFLHGLLMHTLFMLRTADFLSAQYAGIIDRSLLLTGTLLHDFAKSEEFTFSPLGIVTDYSVKGQLLGHLVMGAENAAQTARSLGLPEEKVTLLQHLILSHHGEPAFGAAVIPLCAESELLSEIDKIDSRMEIYRETLAQTPAGTFSGRVFALEHKVYHHN
jgi:3'-5' exoribonuclease